MRRKADIHSKNLSLTSDFEGNSQVKLQCFTDKETILKEEEGWFSTAYRQRTKRVALSFNTDKKDKETIRFITVIYPSKNKKDFPDMKARIKNADQKQQSIEIEVIINGSKQLLKYQL